MSVLTRKDIKRINEESLRILEETGVQVDDEDVVMLLRERGCTVADGGCIVHFPPETVMAALKQCPREVRLAGLDGQATIVKTGGPSIFWTGNAVSLACEQRVEPIDTRRFAEFVHLVDGLEHVHAIVSTCLADVPAPIRGLAGMRLIAENCLKHIRPCVYAPRETKGMIEMAHVLLDGKTIAESPVFSLGYTAVSPLRWSDLALKTFSESSGHRVPLMINSEPAGGVTAPATLAGELVLGNAEALSGVVIVQALEPGRPVIFNMGFAHVMDMQTGIMRTGGVENGLLHAAGAEIAAFHGLPSAAWLNTDSTLVDYGAGYENVLTGLLHVMSNVNIVWGIGNLESTMCISPELAVIGNDIAGAFRRVQTGIRVDAATMATEVIQELGCRAQYLDHPHTLAHFRQEYYFPHVTNRRARSVWQAAGSPSIVDTARSRIAELKAMPVRSIVTPAQRNEMLKIEKIWQKELT
ncbi:MAG: trimethylamine methyltransferase family protein [Kiritimatiellae bacterium]|nr:trimethylamine methyltransferase family protein [Kiritimatiellia bacterium]